MIRWLACMTGVGLLVGMTGCQEAKPLSTMPSVETASALAAGAPAENAARAAEPAGRGAGFDWPNFLGPRRDGISAETGWSTKWPPKGPPELWRAHVGIGYSSLSAVGDRVFTMGHTQGEETVFCLNAQTGKTEWKHTYFCELVNNLHAGGPAATPTVDGDRVYTLSRGGHLFCFETATGKIVWQGNLRDELSLSIPEWGFTSSAVIHGDRVLFQAGAVIALNKATGKTIWKSDARRPAYGSPVVFKWQGQERIASLDTDGLVVLDAANGKTLAEQPWQTSYSTNSSTPIVAEDKLFISTGYGRGGALFRLTATSLEPLWENKNMANHFNNSVLWEGHLYGIDGNSHAASQCTLRCVEFATGELKWKQRGFGVGSLILADGKLIVLSDAGELALVAADPEKFELLARARVLDDECWTAPILARGRIYCRNTPGEVVCLSVAP